MKWFLQIAFIALATLQGLLGCTEMIIPCEDESILVGRTMEFAFDFPYHIVTDPKGQIYKGEPLPKSSSCKGKLHKPKTWRAVAPQIHLVPQHRMLPKVSVGGQGAQGLSVANLYFPGYAVYPTPNEIPKDKCGNTLSHLDVQMYLQSNFKTVQEVRDAINSDEFPFVWGQTVKLPSEETGEMTDTVLPCHWSIIDKTGDALVLEYTKDGRRIHNNTVGVFTNSPSYDWHQQNLKSYVNLQRYPHPDREYNSPNGEKELLQPVGAGSGLLGVPGDITPPSRFIRAAAMVQFSGKAKSAKLATIQAWHLLNAVDITKGVAPPDATGWSVVKDLKNNLFYYRGYDFLGVRKIDLNNVSKKERKYIVLEDTFENSIEDVTDNLESYSDSEKEEL